MGEVWCENGERDEARGAEEGLADLLLRLCHLWRSQRRASSSPPTQTQADHSCIHGPILSLETQTSTQEHNGKEGTRYAAVTRSA